MSDEARFILVELRNEQERYKRLLGDEWKNADDYVFTWEDGKPYLCNYPSRQFRKYADTLGFHSVRLHDERHATATTLHESGMDVKDISDFLGHGSISTTADMYISFTQRKRRKLVDTMERIITGAGLTDLPDTGVKIGVNLS